jgi:type IX secretion system PorP/SprF family membrane protein
VGLADPPLTNSISFYGPHEKLDMGYGGYIYNDVTGPTSRTGFTGAYAYNISLTPTMRLSMGIYLSMLQYRIDGTQLNPRDVSDPVLLTMVSTSYMPDAGLGVYLYADEFYVGLSAAQLLNNKVKVFDNKDGLNRLKTHINLTGGYRYEINRDWALEPSIMVKGTAPMELSFDVTARVEWQKMVWGAVSYRYHDAVSILIGYSYEDMLLFGYSYDIGLSSIRKYNTGTHEIMIGYRFNDVK